MIDYVSLPHCGWAERSRGRVVLHMDPDTATALAVELQALSAHDHGWFDMASALFDLTCDDQSDNARSG